MGGVAVASRKITATLGTFRGGFFGPSPSRAFRTPFPSFLGSLPTIPSS